MLPTTLLFVAILLAFGVACRAAGIGRRDDDAPQRTAIKHRRTRGDRPASRQAGSPPASPPPFRRTLADRLDAAGVREINPGENEELRSEILDHINKGW